MRQTVGQRQKTVCKVDIFYKDCRIIEMEITVTEIPERSDAEGNQLFRQNRRGAFRNTENRKLRVLLMTEAGERIRPGAYRRI